MSKSTLVKILLLLHFDNAWITSIAAPSLEAKSWPPMKSYDIWSNEPSSLSSSSSSAEQSNWEDGYLSKRNDIDNLKGDNYANQSTDEFSSSKRHSKVLNFFPVPVDDECISDDGRRLGICLNVYECRLQGGSAKGECALGFGTCCVFTATCDQEIKNNLTYIISPNFPGLMPPDMTSCKIKVKMINQDISQLRVDFHHFSLGQPNRKTGICDGDIFSMSGGLGGTFTVCGQNSGQHVYYDVGPIKTTRQAPSVNPENIFPGPQTTMVGSTSSSSNIGGGGGSMGNGNGGGIAAVTTANENILGDVEILMNLTNRLFSPRLWEIRVTQIPFSQRAPVGCLQYFTGTQGIIQTFNFADNGRHLANQNYRACIRQESTMCSIAYEPCDENSFRIGQRIPSTNNVRPNGGVGNVFGGPGGPGMFGGAGGGGSGLTVPSGIASGGAPILSDPAIDSIIPANTSPLEDAQSNPLSDVLVTTPIPDASDTALADESQVVEVTTTPPADDAIEGSGGGDTPVVPAAPVRGGFNIFSFFRNAFGYRRRAKQFFSTCTDRITMPCIVEDFIGTDINTLPGCEPVHCGNTFCSSDISPCRMESSVTPFGLGIRFGNGEDKGSAEDNIGACLRYSQMPCL